MPLSAIPENGPIEFFIPGDGEKYLDLNDTLLEFQRMPQGITNAPSTFQRLMEKCMGDMNLIEAIVFLDDIIIFSETLEEHERRLVRVLNRLTEYGLKLSVDKCKFFQRSVKYLAHRIQEWCRNRSRQDQRSKDLA